MGQVISVISGKGGTGKTSLCAAIAVSLSMKGERVLCIDADIGLRNLDISLGLSHEPILPFTAVMRDEYSPSSATFHPEMTNLCMFTAPLTEDIQSLDQEAFGKLLQRAKGQYDWVLIDAPAGIGDGFRLATRFADLALVVAGGDPASLRDAARATDVLLLQRPSMEAKLVVNRVNKRLFSQMRATIDDVMDGVGLPLLGIVPDDVDVTLAAAANVPLPLYKKGPVVVACRNIAERLMGKKVPLLRL